VDTLPGLVTQVSVCMSISAPSMMSAADAEKFWRYTRIAHQDLATLHPLQ